MRYPTADLSTIIGSGLIWATGISSQDASSLFGDLYDQGLANLPVNTTDLINLTPVDTTLRVDLSGGGINSVIPVLWDDVQVFLDSKGVTEHIDTDLIEKGSVLGIAGGGVIGIIDTENPVFS